MMMKSRKTGRGKGASEQLGAPRGKPRGGVVPTRGRAGRRARVDHGQPPLYRNPAQLRVALTMRFRERARKSPHPPPGPSTAPACSRRSSRAVASIMGSQVRTVAPAAWWIVTAGHRGPWRRSWAVRFAPWCRRPGRSSPAAGASTGIRAAAGRSIMGSQVRTVVPSPWWIVTGSRGLDGAFCAAGRSIMGNQVRTAGPAAWWIVTAGHRGPWRHRGVNAGPAPGPMSPGIAGPRRGPARGRGVDHGQPGSHRGAGAGGSSPAAGASTGTGAGRPVDHGQPGSHRGPAAWWIVTAAIEGRGVTVASTRGRRRADRRLQQDLDGDQLAAGRSIMDSQGLDVGQPLGTL